MAPFNIDETRFGALADKVVVVTGGSSGIGLATVQLLHKHKARVVVADRQEQSQALKELGCITFVRADVTAWKELTAVFKSTVDTFGRIDHVFANAGVGSCTSYTEDDVDEEGNLREPNHTTIQVNLIGVANTVKLAVHQMRKQQQGGSIVLTASASSYQRLSVVDYAAAKHGVLGMMRALAGYLYPHVPIRINALAPGWTATGMVTRELADAAGVAAQEPEAVAKSAAILMADGERNQQLIYSNEGQYSEIEQHLLNAADALRTKATQEEDDFQAILRVMKSKGKAPTL